MFKVGDKIKLNKTHAFFKTHYRREGETDFEKVYTIEAIETCRYNLRECKSDIPACPGTIETSPKGGPEGC